MKKIKLTNKQEKLFLFNYQKNSFNSIKKQTLPNNYLTLNYTKTKKKYRTKT